NRTSLPTKGLRRNSKGCSCRSITVMNIMARRSRRNSPQSANLFGRCAVKPGVRLRAWSLAVLTHYHKPGALPGGREEVECHEILGHVSLEDGVSSPRRPGLRRGPAPRDVTQDAARHVAFTSPSRQLSADERV